MERASILSKVTSTTVVVIVKMISISSAAMVSAQSIEPASSVDERISLSFWNWKCWEAIKGLNPCLYDINKSIQDHKVSLGAGCCKAIVSYNDDCLRRIFPFSLFALKMLKNGCNNDSSDRCAPPPGSTHNTDVHDQQQQLQESIPCVSLSNKTSGALTLFTLEIGQCVSIIRSIEGCFEEISTCFFTGEFRILGLGCCQAIMEVNDNCWPMIFPLNPFFSPLIKDHCTSLSVHQLFVQLDAAVPAPIHGGHEEDLRLVSVGPN